MMIEGFLIVTLWKCNNPRVDKNQQTPTPIADFQISVRTVAFTRFNSLCQFKLIFQTEATAPTSFPSSRARVGNERALFALLSRHVQQRAVCGGKPRQQTLVKSRRRAERLQTLTSCHTLR